MTVLARQRSRTVGAGLTLIVLLAAACSSNSSKTSVGASSSSTTSASSNTSVLTGNPVKLMTIIPLTGPAEGFPQIGDAVKAAVKAVNASGGIQGHPVQIEVCDDAFSPNTAAQCARKAVSDKVLAVVGSQSAMGDSYTPILQAASIPLVGTAPNSTAESISPDSFPLQASSATVAGSAGILAKNGATKINVSVPDIAAAAFLVKFFNGGLTPFNQQVASTVRVPADATDLSSYASRLVTSANGAVVLAGGTQAKLVMKAIHQSGASNVKISLATATISPQDISDLGAAAEGAYLTSPIPQPTDTTDPGIQQFLKEIKDAGVDANKMDWASVMSWASVHVTSNVAQKLTTLDGASLIAALNSAGPISFAPLPTIDFSKPTSQGLRSFGGAEFFSQVKDGKIVPLFDGKSSTPADLPKL